MKDIKVLTSTNNTGIGWLLEVIAITTCLVNKKQNSKVEILLLDGSPFFFKEKILATLIRVYKLNNFFYELIFIFLRIFFINKKKINRIYQDCKLDSIQNNLLIGHITNLTNKNCYIKIKNFHKSFYIFYFFLSFYKSVKFWLKIILKKKRYNLFLKFKNDHIQIGDLVASSFLRIYPSYGGRLKLNFKLFNLFFKCIYLNEVSKNLNKKKLSEYYFMNSEPIYIENFWRRKFFLLGLKIIETHSYDGKLKVINNKKNYRDPWILPPKNRIKFSANKILKIKNYFIKRFNRPHTVLEYLRKNATNNNNNKELKDFKNSKINIQKNKIYAVIYLHAFEDAQYCFGINDFKDIYEWTEYTIKKCLENKNFFQVLIKPHPTINNDYQADKIAYNNLVKSFSESNRVIFLKPQTSITNHLTNFRFYHFVHHGSVAVELAYLDQQVVGYAGGPWNNNYKFLTTWNSKYQYEKIIKNIQNTKIVKKKILKNNLYSFVEKAYLNSLSLKNRSIRLLISKKYPQFKNEIGGVKKLAYQLKRLNVRSKLLMCMLDIIFRKYSKLNKIY